MAGIFGIYSKKNKDCVNELFLGTFYLQHRAQQYCGMAVYRSGRFYDSTHKGKIRDIFESGNMKNLTGSFGIATVNTSRQPVSIYSKNTGFLMAFDGNLANLASLKKTLLTNGNTFAGYTNPKYVPDEEIITKIIASEGNIPDGIEKLTKLMKGDYAILILAKNGIYAARGWGRKPFILGVNDDYYAVSSESCSFLNLNIDIVRDVKPGEIVLINNKGITGVKQLKLAPVKYGTFEWIYTASPASIIDGVSVEQARNNMGMLLAKRYPIKADIVGEVPNSGMGHAIGYAIGSKLPHKRVFIRYDYADRSYTQKNKKERRKEADLKLLPISANVKGKKVIIADDSIVRGTQFKENLVKKLKKAGAKEIHAIIACPPLMDKCNYGKTTKKMKDCIARTMPINKIHKYLGLDSVNYAKREDLSNAIGKPLSELCLECW